MWSPVSGTESLDEFVVLFAVFSSQFVPLWYLMLQNISVFSLLSAHMKSVLDCSFLWFWSVLCSFISVLAEALVHDGLWSLQVFVVASCGTGSLGLWGSGFNMSLCCVLALWRCGEGNQTLWSVPSLSSSISSSCRLPQNIHRLQISVSMSGRPSTAEKTEKTNLCIDLWTGGATWGPVMWLDQDGSGLPVSRSKPHKPAPNNNQQLSILKNKLDL